VRASATEGAEPAQPLRSTCASRDATTTASSRNREHYPPDLQPTDRAPLDEQAVITRFTPAGARSPAAGTASTPSPVGHIATPTCDGPSRATPSCFDYTAWISCRRRLAWRRQPGAAAVVAITRRPCGRGRAATLCSPFRARRRSVGRNRARPIMSAAEVAAVLGLARHQRGRRLTGDGARQRIGHPPELPAPRHEDGTDKTSPHRATMPCATAHATVRLPTGGGEHAADPAL
jgi:hypothetical protein